MCEKFPALSLKTYAFLWDDSDFFSTLNNKSLQCRHLDVHPLKPYDFEKKRSPQRGHLVFITHTPINVVSIIQKKRTYKMIGSPAIKPNNIPMGIYNKNITQKNFFLQRILLRLVEKSPKPSTSNFIKINYILIIIN
jgi:hypothetical protein